MGKKKIVKKPELLAPAGDLERLKIAFLYGADAVYVGGMLYGLRANTPNFTLSELEEGVSYAHKLGKKVYVTLNIVLHNQEIDGLVSYIKELDRIGIDAIIVSDPAIITLAHEHASFEVHLSTQQSTLNREAVEFWKEQGVTRIVLGREASRDDIQSIMDHVDIEIECFIHGAMCASYSGRCVLSNYLTARDSNRGGCSQICRWDFILQDDFGNDCKGDEPFSFCTKDLSMLKYIPDMIDMGIASFKIEGRMRSMYYIATVVDAYRKEIDKYCHNPLNYEYNVAYEKVLRGCANRDSVPQFFNHKYDADCQYYMGRDETTNQDFLGVVLDYDDKTGYATIEQRNKFFIDQKVEIFGPSIDNFTFQINEIIDENGDKIEFANHPKQIVKIKVPHPVYENDLMRNRDDKNGLDKMIYL